MSQLTSLWHYLNSSQNVSTAIVGVAASFAGAWGAQIAIFRRDQRREVVATLRATNAAQALCFSIGNSFMALKKQHLIGMLVRFREMENQFEEFMAKRQAAKEGEQQEKFLFQADLHTLPISKVPMDRLESIVFEKLTLDTKTLSLAIAVSTAIDALNTSTASRNDMITKWYEGPARPDDEILIRYLGIPFEGGADEKYKQTLFAIESYCNDCIHFCRELAEALTKHGQGVRRKYRHHIFWRLPKVAKADYSAPEVQALLPDPKEYEQWHKGFASEPTKWEMIKDFCSRKKKVATPPKDPET
ncbi:MULTISPECIES: hypothetical protein [unclassified Mesorhizobium]|uniref:hypothetical protein n=1 Tax=unclassified Mesorhizobium TaxID=325217 RepID=UPI000FE4B46F|nr:MULTISPECIES: hypothetical protein [unclassified Mesorhizobium]RWF49752.1 MAG: hypothetical protein EOS46_05815 [Mesorhizobium sp.]TGT89640.1 hypothetical protein EN804_12195 [Mesorhizobium sp. M8A.F.Ca.ET.161.01.1.1]TGV42198.1 hypothetical protein EN785_12180 [Mesorhizobium sp. M8A.F.Ca.ET.142.01.1.1]